MSVVLAPFRGLVTDFCTYIQSAKCIPDGARCSNCGRPCKFDALGPKAADHVVCGRWLGEVRLGRSQ